MARSVISQVEEFDPERVRPLPDQPRKRFSRIKELAESIAEIGQSMPGIVIRVESDPRFDVMLVDGERRLRACKMARVKFRAEVKEGLEDAETIFAASFAANFGKQDHDAIEIAHGLARMRASGKTIAEMARIAGMSTAWASQHLRLLELHPTVQAMMIPKDDEETSPLNSALAQILVPLPHPRQIVLAQKIVKTGMSGAAARRMILREHRAANVKAAQGPTRKLRTLASILGNAEDRIGVYVDMPGAEINKLIDAMSDDEKRLVVKVADELASSLQCISEAISSRQKKARAGQVLVRNGAGAGEARYLG